MVLMCVGSIELVWGGKIWKNGRKTHILGIFGDMYRYTLNLYRYILGSCRFWPTCTGIGQTCTGTPCSILTNVRILAITYSFLIRIE